jgi:hypothetical protein
MADDHLARLERVLQGLEKAREFAESFHFEITDEYRALIARVQEMPCNRPGADKSHIWPGLRAYIDTFKAAKLVPRS